MYKHIRPKALKYENSLLFLIVIILTLLLMASSYVKAEQDQVTIAPSTQTNIELLTATTGLNKVKLLLLISQQLQADTPQQALNYAKQALTLSQNLNQPQLISDIHFSLLTIYQTLNDKSQVKNTLDLAITHAEKHELTNSVAKFYNELARYYWMQSNYELALDSLNKALPAYNQVNNRVKVATIYNNIGIIQRNFGDYEKSLEAYSTALKLRKEIGDKEKIALTLNNIGILYKDFNYLDEALEVLLNAVAIFEELKLSENLADPLNNIGLVYQKMGKLDVALSYLEKSLAIEVSLKNDRGISYSLNNIGALYRKKKNYELSLKQLTKALSIAEELGEKSLISRIYRELALNNIAVKNYALAKNNINLSLDYSTQIKDKEQQRLNYQVSADIFSKTNSFQEAFYAYQKYKTLSDEINNENINQQILKFQNRIEIEKKQNEINLLIKQNEINLLDLKRENAIRNSVIISTIALLIIITLLYARRVNKNRLKKERSLNKKLTQLDLLKDQLLSNTTHELLTPLNGIIGLSESLIVRESDTETKETMALISKSGRELEKLVHNILDLSNLTTDNMALNFEQLNINQTCTEVITLLEPAAKEKKIKLEFYGHDKKLLVKADEVRMRQVIFILISNAIKFTESGSVKLESSKNDQDIIIKISDKGIGIPKEKLQSIFEAFEQVDGTSTRVHGGAGLGLAITKKLVELHQGRIWAESIEGKGSQFYISLPAIT
jgi:signal transduction histidine kinase/tetratricopeptide (TPR) repeat protein